MANIYVETYGCTANQSDGEIMKGLLNKSGFKIVQSEDIADIVIVNSCSVKQTTENKIRSKLEKLKGKMSEEKIIITGCMPESEYDFLKEVVPKSNLVSTHNIKEIPKAVKKTIEGEDLEYIGKVREDKLCLPKIRDNPLIAKVQIGRGCINSCNFCSTKIAKGNLYSYPQDKILKEVKLSLNNDCKEIQLTSQDNGCYGFDRDTNLAELLEKIVQISGKFRIRVGMINPHNILVKDFLDNLVDIYRDDKIYNFLHLPVQSGSDQILEEMNRQHSAKDFLEIVERFRDEIDNLNLWTDFIVGFPDETEEDFKRSMDLLKKIEPGHVNISRFTPRPNTPAKNMDQIDSKIRKERSRRMSKLVRKITSERDKKWDGKESEVLVTEKIGKNKYKGRNESYKPVLIESSEDPRGKSIKVSLHYNDSRLIGQYKA